MKYFGTDGFRGKAGEVLKVEHALKIGQFLGWYFGLKDNKKCKCVIGKDTRRSSYMFEYALTSGLVSTGCDTYLMHVTTTPSVSYIAKTEDFDFGIMITASHNPFYDNGIKIIDKNGYKMSEDVLEEIEKYIDGLTDISFAVAEEIGVVKDYIAGRNKYMSFLTAIPEQSFRGYRIGIDCANGASSSIARNVFETLGADTYVMGNEPDGDNINVACGSTHMDAFAEFVKNNKLDMGFAFDGDADRCMAVDEFGNVIDGDGIIYIGAKYLKEKNELKDNTAVVTVMSNLGLFNALKDNGIAAVTTDVGDKYVSAEIMANGYGIGGEQSGHIILSQYATTGDGILTAIFMASICIERKTVFSSLVNGLNILPQKLKNITVQDKNAIMANPAVKEYIDKTNASLDGKGRLLLRKSGTEPLIRIMVEHQTLDDCDKEIEAAHEFINSIM